MPTDQEVKVLHLLEAQTVRVACQKSCSCHQKFTQSSPPCLHIELKIETSTLIQQTKILPVSLLH